MSKDNGWWEVDEWNLTDDNGAAMHVASISCEDCNVLVGWDDTGFTPYMTDYRETVSLCHDCYSEWLLSGD